MSDARWKPNEVAVPRLPIRGDYDTSARTSVNLDMRCLLPTLASR
jgi:hypothetical protein